MSRVPKYYKICVMENDKEKEVEIFDIQIKRSKLFTAWHIISDIQRYIYRFDKKTKNHQEWVKDLKKAMVEVIKLKELKLNFFQRMILKRNVLFELDDKSINEFKKLNRVSENQVSCLVYLAKFNLNRVLFELDLMIEFIKKGDYTNIGDEF